MQKLQPRQPVAMIDLAKLNYHYFEVITIAFDGIPTRFLNPFHKRDLTFRPYYLRFVFVEVEVS